MIKWLKVMCHPDGGISFFNDSSHKIAISLEEILSYAKRLNIVDNEYQPRNLTYLKDSGYVRVDIKDLVLISDIAKIGPDYIPGHGHADALSFELSIFGRRVVVNSGTSTYESNNERQKQRSTLSHSTINVDGKDSSEVWGSFRVARRAKISNINISLGEDIYSFSASHNGFTRFQPGLIHSRKWNVASGKIEIIDNVTGRDHHIVESILPLHPEVEVGDFDNSSVELKVNGKLIRVNFKGNGSLKVLSSKYYPQFGMSIANKRLVYVYNGNLPYKLSTLIQW